MIRTKDDFIEMLVNGKPLPEIDENEVELPVGVYVCLSCGEPQPDRKKMNISGCDDCLQKAGIL